MGDFLAFVVSLAVLWWLTRKGLRFIDRETEALQNDRRVHDVYAESERRMHEQMRQIAGEAWR